MGLFSIKRGFLAALLLLAMTLIGEQKLYAEISYLQMKGIHSLLKQECQDLSPIHGFTALKTNILSNIRFFGNYGFKKDPLGCHDQISSYQQNMDCPQDWTTALVQQLFPSPDGQNFVANQGSTADPLSNLSPSQIGRLLELIHFSVKGDAGKNDKEANDSWTLAVFRALHPGEFDQTIKKLNKNYQQFEKQKNLLQEQVRCQVEGDSQVAQIESLKKELENITQKLKTIEVSTQEMLMGELKRKENWKLTRPFAKILFHALKEVDDEGSPYPKNLVQSVLQAYLWKKANHRQDFLEFAKAIPECLSDDAKKWIFPTPKLDAPKKKTTKIKPTDEEIKQAQQEKQGRQQLYQKLEEKRLVHEKKWLEKSYAPEDYLDWKSSYKAKKPTEGQIKELESNLELAAFYAHSYDVIDQKLPPIVGYSEAAHKSLGKVRTVRKYNTYPDCGETSLLNFFDIVLYDEKEGKFNASYLEDVQRDKNLKLFQAQGKKTEKGLLSFYRRNSDPANAETAEVHDDWSRRVVSALPHVDYRKGGGKCEINAGMKNMQSVMGALLGDPIWDTLSSPAAKWDRICELFSREGFKLDWKIKDGDKHLKEDTGTLVFSVGGKPAFEWNFSSGHFFIREAENSGRGLEDWRRARNGIGKQSLILAEQPWFWRGGIASNPKKIWRYDLKSNENKLNAMKNLVTQEKAKGLYPSIKNWIRRLPADDLNTQAKIFNSIVGVGDFGQEFFQSDIRHAKAKLEEDRKKSIILCIDDSLDHALSNLNLTSEELSLKNERQDSVAHVAGVSGNLNLAKYISEKNPSIFLEKNAYKETPVHKAADSHHWEFVKFIGEKFPDTLRVENPQEQDELLVEMALFDKESEIFQWIATQFPESLRQKNREKSNAAHNAAYEAVKKDQVGNLKFIAEKAPETFEEVNNEGFTAFAILEDHVKQGKLSQAVLDEVKEIVEKAKKSKTNTLVNH
jgi:hypothetical protein